MNKDENIVSTIEELEQFINNHENCVVYATSELAYKLNNAMKITSDASSASIDLFFKIYEWMNIMAEKSIIFEVKI